jgi:Carboxypeptidase regulatory-like domain/TonB-dependent Receptor Plug Domain
MTHVSKAVCAMIALALFLATPRLAFAQSQATTAEINGRLTDANGGVLPGVTVTAASPETGYTRTVVSNGEGLFSLPLLPPGNYDLSAELAGFATFRQMVRATVGANVTINAAMRVAGVQETITVEAATPLVETSSAIRTTTVDEEAIRHLPINGRRFQDFLTLTPTVQVDTQRGQLSFAGQRGINANVSIDGADYNQPFFGGIRGGERSNNAFTIPQEAIREFQVIASGYSAEFGRSTGGLVNAITKAGTNTPSGSFFYVNRNKDWAEQNAFGQNAAPTQHQFGGSVGGPIAANRLFYFVAGELQRQENTRNVVFALTGITPTADTAEAYNFFKGLEEPFDTTNDAEAILGRVDYQMPQGNRFVVRYSFSNNKALNANASGNALSDTTISAVSNNGTERDRTNTVVGEFTSTLRSSTLLEIRGQYSREERPRDANELMPLITGTVGNVGTVSFLGENIQRDWRGQAAVNATWVKSSHTAKFGLEYNHVNASQLFGFDQFGTYQIFGTSPTMLEVLSVGGPTANRFDSPRAVVQYRLQIGNLSTALATDEIALFAQDSWRLAPTFTFNYGLRWEGTFNPTPEANNDFILNALRGVTFPIGKGIDPTQIPDQFGQFGPRVGFAWNPGSGTTVVRGFSGIYYARSPMLLFSDPMSGFRVPPGNLTVTLPYQVPVTNPNDTLYEQLALIGINLNATPLSGLPRLTMDQLTAIAARLGITPNPYVGVNVMGVDQDFKNPRATQVGGGIEREISTNLSLGADVLYVKTDNLQRNRDLNIGVPTPRATDPAQRPIFPARPLSALNQVQIRESSAESEYTAMTLSSRLRRNWALFNVNYVLSKSMSDDDNERDSGGVQFENTFDLGPEWGPARLDRRHQFNGYAVFFLPYSVDLSTSFRFLSGLPIDASIGRDINNSQGGADRPYSGPGQPFQRNGFRDQAFKEVNFRASWGPTFAGRNRVAVTFDVFNVFDTDNIRMALASANTTVTNYCAGTAPDDCGFGPPTNPNFLQVKDANGNYILTNAPGAPRQVQLGVRFEF